MVKKLFTFIFEFEGKQFTGYAACFNTDELRDFTYPFKLVKIVSCGLYRETDEEE